MAEFILDTTINAEDLTRGGAMNYVGWKRPTEWQCLTLSVKCGEKIHVWHHNDHAMFIQGSKPFGAETYLVNGRYSTMHRGGAKVVSAIKDLCERFLRLGVAEGLKEFTDKRVICCCCGADLTDPESRRRRIGPKCITTFHGMALAHALKLPA